MALTMNWLIVYDLVAFVGGIVMGVSLIKTPHHYPRRDHYE